MSVADFARARGEREASRGAECPCGSQWFALAGGSATPVGSENGAVSMTSTGRVTGYFGTPRCVECGTPWHPGVQDAPSAVRQQAVVSVSELRSTSRRTSRRGHKDLGAWQ